MLCPKCNATNESGDNFCTSCSASMAATPQMSNTNKQKILIIVTSALILLLIIIGAILVAGGSKPLCSFALHGLGDMYLLELNYEQAHEQFEKIIEIDPENPNGYIGLAKVYIGMGNNNEAFNILEQGNNKVSSAEIRRMRSELRAELQPLEEDIDVN
ncbi:MAG: tetratricopeptide repeat protein [Oscillospiraceae bacterium]|nr:tetratricopeptide repeat protein [Oscillospiraceae bacterium]